MTESTMTEDEHCPKCGSLKIRPKLGRWWGCKICQGIFESPDKTPLRSFKMHIEIREQEGKASQGFAISPEIEAHTLEAAFIQVQPRLDRIIKALDGATEEIQKAGGG